MPSTSHPLYTHLDIRFRAKDGPFRENLSELFSEIEEENLRHLGFKEKTDMGEQEKVSTIWDHIGPRIA